MQLRVFSHFLIASSSTTTPYLSNRGSLIASLNNIPSVMYLYKVMEWHHTKSWLSFFSQNSCLPYMQLSSLCPLCSPFFPSSSPSILSLPPYPLCSPSFPSSSPSSLTSVLFWKRYNLQTWWSTPLPVPGWHPSRLQHAEPRSWPLLSWVECRLRLSWRTTETFQTTTGESTERNEHTHWIVLTITHQSNMHLLYMHLERHTSTRQTTWRE